MKAPRAGCQITPMEQRIAKIPKTMYQPQFRVPYRFRSIEEPVAEKPLNISQNAKTNGSTSMLSPGLAIKNIPKIKSIIPPANYHPQLLIPFLFAKAKAISNKPLTNIETLNKILSAT